MSSAIPWSVKGVEPEAREAAKLAARRQDVPVGQWLTQTILASATQELKHTRRKSEASESANANVQDTASSPHEAPDNAIDETADASVGRGGPPALTPEAILESIQKLANRVEESEARTAEAITPLAERIANLDDQIGTIKESGTVSTAPVERAMMRLTERLEKLEGGHRKEPEGGFLAKLFSRG